MSASCSPESVVILGSTAKKIKVAHQLTSRGEVFLGCPGGPNVSTRVLIVEGGGLSERANDAPPSLEMEEGAVSQACRQPPEVGKDKETDSSPVRPKGTQP